MTQQTEKPTAVLYDSIRTGDKISAHVTVLDKSREWIGDFWVDFEHRPRREQPNRYVADWDTVKSGGNGIYFDGEPCFWMVEAIVSDLREEYEQETLITIDSGPNDV